MGTWGTGIFDDDTACDVRGHYRRALRAGVPGPEATDQLLRAYAPGPDPFDTPIWLGLAATQTKLGRLEERVKTTALEVIDSGANLAAWAEADAATRRSRRTALQRLRRRLLGPQRPRCSSSRHGAKTPPWNQASTCCSGSQTASR
jgi:hypothetical protein